MTASNFAKCLAFTLQQEGGFVNDPHDPGGATNKGITLATMRAYLHEEATVQDLENISDRDVASIYLGMFWVRMACARLPRGPDLMTFDSGVNMGQARAVGYLQVVAGVRQDGIDGARTQEAIAKMSPTLVITKLAGLYKAHYEALPDFDRYGHGWLARNERRVKAALEMVETAA